MNWGGVDSELPDTNIVLLVFKLTTKRTCSACPQAHHRKTRSNLHRTDLLIDHMKTPKRNTIVEISVDTRLHTSGVRTQDSEFCLLFDGVLLLRVSKTPLQPAKNFISSFPRFTHRTTNKSKRTLCLRQQVRMSLHHSSRSQEPNPNAANVTSNMPFVSHCTAGRKSQQHQIVYLTSCLSGFQ